MNASEINELLTNFIIESALDGDGSDLDEHTPLLELNLVDSSQLLSLVIFIDKRLGVSIPEDRMSPRYFHSIATLRALILELQDQSAEGRDNAGEA